MFLGKGIFLLSDYKNIFSYIVYFQICPEAVAENEMNILVIPSLLICKIIRAQSIRRKRIYYYQLKWIKKSRMIQGEPK